MKILFDDGTPKPIARGLLSHDVTFARQIGWHELENGELIQKAEDAGFHVLLSTDKNIRYQQNLTGRRIALVILGKLSVANCAVASGRHQCRSECEYAGKLCRGLDSLPAKDAQHLRIPNLRIAMWDNLIFRCGFSGHLTFPNAGMGLRLISHIKTLRAYLLRPLLKPR
jgi:hypothetical protein